ncbi:universal stress protein [Amycolatopsis sp. CA-161197]|uniref:universal stress protein n=1 Tax=Amycolatopsis sp. CA-161197 TaxID=3239922 RepID=UPI003D939600
MSATEPRITVGVDGSAGSTAAVAWAARAAARRHVGLKIVHGLQFAGPYYFGVGAEALFDAILADGRRVVADSRGLALSLDPGLAVSTELPDETPARVLIEESRHSRMVVVGKTGAGGFTEQLVGGTAATVAAHAHCPVVVVRGQGEPGAGPVVVGVDGSPTGDQAIAVAFEEASLLGAPLVALHAWHDGAAHNTADSAHPGAFDECERRLLDERLSGWQEKYPDVGIQWRLVRDRPRQALIEASATARLVVVGSRGRGGFAGMVLGSTSQALVERAACPVIVVRPEAEA